ncbi:farnesyl-diphosphate farnesyltransferase [Geosmithia morbida]|uniref:Squalene synthase n=1 Tax=Geosmithia morbida TaxID=1094350 RepID=A0A9P4YYN4_9HYPO|nr:farnesyl-diphosphate farnesyltransferase [Geosmithia morbida]KAF4124932.1 farnesyl-diphosphate farnesyltransferase [Geosmithia morbida]
MELNPELLVPVALFYLVLRGLDTVEDDMTIPLDEKVPILRNFYKTMLEDGWQYHKSQEKDRALLEHFDVVVTELKKIPKSHLDVIQDIAQKMGSGMADYVQNDDMIKNGVKTIDEYELYCHYVAGLVGEGLTRLFLASDLAHPKLAERPQLTESMGQMLQKVNIIRDIREDWDDGRRWYPREVWSKYVDEWDHMFDPKYRDQALNCVSEMVLHALKHTEECLFYMAGMREQSVFNFVAIPQGMAIATLDAVFRNPAIFERNVKITKGEACKIMLESTQNLQTECEVFRRYVKSIQKKNDPKDPNFLAISTQCAKVCLASLYMISAKEKKRERERGEKERGEREGEERMMTNSTQIEQFIETLFPKQDPQKLSKELEAKRKDVGGELTSSPRDAILIFSIAIGCLVFVAGIMFFIAWMFGAKFGNWLDDIDTKRLTGVASSSAAGAATQAAAIGHEEL